MEQLKPEWAVFCREYIFDWNASRAYRIAYPSEKSEETIRAAASRLLTNVNIQAHIEEIQKDLEKQAGLSRLKVLSEYQKMAFTSIADLHNTWISRKELEELTDDQKASISEIQTRAIPTEHGSIEEVKIKLHDKSKALEAINKMLGYNEPEKIEHFGDGLVPLTVTKASEK